MSETKKSPRLFLLVSLVCSCLWMEWYFHVRQGVTTVYPHLFYLPIILAAYLYGLKGGFFCSLLLAAVHNILAFRFSYDLLLRGVAMVAVGVSIGYSNSLMGRYSRRASESTERHRSLLEKSDRERAILDQLFENAPMALFFCDDKRRVFQVNAEAERIFGYREREARGKTLEDLIVPEEDRAFGSSLSDDVHESRKTVRFSAQRRRMDGSLLTVECIGFPLILEGEVMGSVVIYQDITEYKRREEKMSLLGQMLDSAPVSLSIHDTEGRFLYANRETTELHGYEEDEFMALNLNDLEKVGSESLVAERVRMIAEHGEVSYEAVHFRKDGSSFPVQILVKAIEWCGNPALLSIANDITGRKMAEEALFFEKERFKTTLLSIGDGVISTDNSRNILIMNKVAENLTGWTNAEARGKSMEKVLEIISEATGERCNDLAQRVLDTGEKTDHADHAVMISRDGRMIPVEDSAAPIRDMAGETTGVVIVFRDCTEKRERQREIEYLSYHDQLTGLYNRRFFDEELKRLDVPRNLPLSLVMIDVNGLKMFNDAFGHLAGDDLLKRVADVLKREFRADDIVARFGGDEFVVLLPWTNSEQVAPMLARIDASMANEQVEKVPLSVSCGWGTKTDIHENIAKTFETAEDHMYRKKISQKTSYNQRSVQLILETLYSKLPGEQAHSSHVSRLCEWVGNGMGLSGTEVHELKTAGVMHDIGKIGISKYIMDKKGPFDDVEWGEIRKHPETGFNILSAVNEYGSVAEIILSHHERWDGKGYPRGLRGEEIPLYARIIAIAEAYDAMVSGTNYRKAMSKEEALIELESCAGAQFAPDIVPVFISNALGHQETIDPLS